MTELERYKALKEAGFPQGGRGNWIQDPNSDSKYYIPNPDEIYSQFLGDPEHWRKLTDTLAEAWITNGKKTY